MTKLLWKRSPRRDRRVRCAVACFTLHWSAPPRLQPLRISKKSRKGLTCLDGGGGGSREQERRCQRDLARHRAARSSRTHRPPRLIGCPASRAALSWAAAAVAAPPPPPVASGQQRRGSERRRGTRSTLGPSELGRKARARVRSRAWRREARGREEAGRGGGERVAGAAAAAVGGGRKELETRIAAEKGGSGGGSAALTERRVAAERAAAAAPRSARWKTAVRDAEIARENAERLAASKREAASMKKKLWARCKSSARRSTGTTCARRSSRASARPSTPRARRTRWRARAARDGGVQAGRAPRDGQGEGGAGARAVGRGRGARREADRQHQGRARSRGGAATRDHARPSRPQRRRRSASRM